MHVQGNDRLKHPSKSVPQSSAVPDEPVNLRPGTLLQINLEHVRKELNVKVRLIDQEDHWLIRQIGHSNLANDSVRIYSYQPVFPCDITQDLDLKRMCPSLALLPTSIAASRPEAHSLFSSLLLGNLHARSF